MTISNINAKVRIASVSWKPDSFESNGILYSRDIPLEEADGLLGLYDPMDDLLKFKGPKLWYSYEPQWHGHYHKNSIGKTLVKTLKQSEWVYYANPDPHYRVPHITVADQATKVRASSSRSGTVATVSNFGGKFWFLKRHIILRNRMALCPIVDLYGREDSWRNFTHFPALWQKKLPSNYKGEAPGNHLDETFLSFLSHFKVCVCLENSCEPYYFTEKFVNAVRAGCIPIYHAHSTVKEHFLKGALWVDPQDFNFNPQQTIEYALTQNIHSYQIVNDAWLDSGILDSSTTQGFWKQICKLMTEKLSHNL